MIKFINKLKQMMKRDKKYEEFYSNQDPTGSYTGNSVDNEVPEQDADDL